MMKKIVVIAAHPDDEVLGCGGTIASAIRCGCHVHVLFVTDGSRGQADCIIPALEQLGGPEWFRLRFPELKMHDQLSSRLS